MKQIVKSHAPSIFKRASRTLAKSLLASALLFGSTAHAEHLQHTSFANLAKPKMTIEQKFNYGGNCSGYATRISHALFGINYNKNPAWLLGESNKVLVRGPFSRKTKTGSLPREDIEDLIQHGKLKPGYLLGCYNPTSGYRDKYDVTHTVIYVGKDAHNTPIFWHNFGKSGTIGVRKETLDTLYRLNNGTQRVYVVEVIAPKN